MPGGVYKGGGVTVVMDPPSVVYAEVFYDGSTPDGYLRRRARRVAILANELAPIGKTGRLSGSVKASQNRDKLGRFTFGFKVYTTVGYARYVHEGTAPRTQYSVGKKMKFFGTNEYSSSVIYTHVVHHPGNRAQPFLRNALVAMVN